MFCFHISYSQVLHHSFPSGSAVTKQNMPIIIIRPDTNSCNREQDLTDMWNPQPIKAEPYKPVLSASLKCLIYQHLHTLLIALPKPHDSIARFCLGTNLLPECIFLYYYCLFWANFEAKTGPNDFLK